MTIKKTVSPIVFNNHNVSTIEIEESAQKHYKEKSSEIFQEITQKLNGQVRQPDEVNRSAEDVYKVASCVSFDFRNYRDTCFKLYPESGLIKYFHGSPLKKKQFDRLSVKVKKRNS